MSNASEAPKRIHIAFTRPDEQGRQQIRKWDTHPITQSMRPEPVEYILAPSHADHIKAAVAGMPDLKFRPCRTTLRGIAESAKSELGLFKVLGNTGFYATLDDAIISDVEKTMDLAKASANFYMRKQLAKTLKGE